MLVRLADMALVHAPFRPIDMRDIALPLDVAERAPDYRVVPVTQIGAALSAARSHATGMRLLPPPPQAAAPIVLSSNFSVSAHA